MKSEQKIIKTDESFDVEIEREDEDDELHNELNKALKEHQSVKRLIDYFVLGLFLIFILYTFI
jgi:DNA-directed RNA polymerase subunit L